jgi:acetyl esterase
VRILRPKTSRELLPIIVFFHGGGWVLGNRQTADRLAGDLAVVADAAVAIVEYSRAPEAQYPVAIEECYAATQYLYENAAQLRLDSSRLAVAGDSAGGNLAAVVCLKAKQLDGPRIRAQLLMYPVTDADFETASYRCFQSGYFLTREESRWFWSRYLPDATQRMQPTASPLRASLSDLEGVPPALVITAEFDVLRDEGEAYAHRLIEARVEVTAVRFLGTIHSFLSQNALARTPAAMAALEMIGDYLRRRLRSDQEHPEPEGRSLSGVVVEMVEDAA